MYVEAIMSLLRVHARGTSLSEIFLRIFRRNVQPHKHKGCASTYSYSRPGSLANPRSRNPAQRGSFKNELGRLCREESCTGSLWVLSKVVLAFVVAQFFFAFLAYRILNPSVYNKCVRNSIPSSRFNYERLLQIGAFAKACVWEPFSLQPLNSSFSTTHTMKLFCWIMEQSIMPFAVERNFAGETSCTCWSWDRSTKTLEG